jgi:hypothetical protein
MRADYVVNCGLFTVSGGTDPARWWEYCRAVIGRMFELSHVGIAFNMMTSHVDYRDDHLFYAKPGDVVDFCADSLSRRVVLRHDYPLYEFTVYVYR